MTSRVWRPALLALVAVAAACTVNPPPVTVTAPKYPDYPPLATPAGLKSSPDVASQMDIAWRRMQSGDLTGAHHDYAAILQAHPDFYPAAAGLGYVSLASRDFKSAAAEFASALKADGRYRPALDGRATTALASGDDAGAVEALQALLKVDPTNESARTRLEVARSRQVQHAIDTAHRLREAGRTDDARAALVAVMGDSPGAVLLRELALVEMTKGDLAAAEDHARKATTADPGDAEAWAALADVLDRSGRPSLAADAMARAFTIDPRPAWRDRRDALRARATEAAEPKAFRDIATSQSVTRADVAAMIGLRLGDVLDKSPRHVTVVASDARASWASAWILQVTQAGIMDVFANHTFQPTAPVRRSTLSEIVARLLALLSAERGTDLTRWKTATPAFSDLPSANSGYAAAAIAVTAGAMTAPAGKFNGMQPATGADLVAAIARIQQLAR